jgi:hypothetical protein
MMTNLKKQSSSRVERYPKILFVLSRCMITEDDGSRDLYSWSHMHVYERDEVVWTTRQWRR